MKEEIISFSTVQHPPQAMKAESNKGMNKWSEMEIAENCRA